MNDRRAAVRPVGDAASKVERVAFGSLKGDAGATKLMIASANRREPRPAHDHRDGLSRRHDLLANFRLGALACKGLVHPLVELRAEPLGDSDHWQANRVPEANGSHPSKAVALRDCRPKRLGERLLCPPGKRRGPRQRRNAAAWRAILTQTDRATLPGEQLQIGVSRDCWVRRRARQLELDATRAVRAAGDPLVHPAWAEPLCRQRPGAGVPSLSSAPPRWLGPAHRFPAS